MKKGPKDWSPHHRADIEHVQLGQCLIILAPDWFHRGDFQKWRSGSGVATWHDRSPEGQDVFIVFADRELDWHTSKLPADIYEKLDRAVRSSDMEYGVVWIKAV
jgi:hypothetical protein